MSDMVLNKKSFMSRFYLYGGNFLFILPAVLIFGVFYIYPFLDIFNLSFQEWDGINPIREYVGFENYQSLFPPDANIDWWKSILNAGYITVFALTIQNMLAFGLAMACDREIRMKRFYRLVFFLPPVLSEIVVGILWRLILNPLSQGGLLNQWLASVGLHHMVDAWLSNPDTALTCIAVVHSWKGFGWGFIMFLAGLQTIDRQLYEAARVDGANAWERFCNVTIPMMIPVILVVVILTILGSMQAFILVLSMTPGGLSGHTDVPVLQILTTMTTYKEYGTACAMGVIFAGILITVSLFFKIMSDRVKQA